MIDIFLNGSAHPVPDSTTIDGLIESLGIPRKGIALALNSEVIPQSGWMERLLLPHDKVELLTIAQGG
ncbi:MAG: sulfur carrier protein ThiS [Acidimicrobiaceae bacterium]|nr:sulfur carrier protein ThiS [Acidimicrobiaceae bacterium]